MNKKKVLWWGSAIIIGVIISLIILLQPESYTAKVLNYELTTSDTDARVVFEITNNTEQDVIYMVTVYTKKNGKETYQTWTLVPVEAKATKKWVVEFSSVFSLIGSKVVLSVQETSW